MEDITFPNEKSIKIFLEKFSKEKNKIFEYIYNLFENQSNNEEKNEMIQNIANQKTKKINDKVSEIKEITYQKYLNNFRDYYNPEELKKYNLGLIVSSYPFPIQLVYYLNNKEESKKNKEKEIIIKAKTEKNYNKIAQNKKLDKIEEKMDDYLILLDIDFITKIKINDDEEWICNSEYALYLIYKVKNLKNPHPANDDNESNDDSSYSLIDKMDIEHFIFVTNNKDNQTKKKVIEIEADFDVSNIYEDIKKKYSSNYSNEYIKYSIQDDNIKDIEDFIEKENYENNQIYKYFKNLCDEKTMKNIIFHDENPLNSFDKIKTLNYLYYKEIIRFLYLDLNVLNQINNTNEKRKYLTYYISRIYNCNTKFKNDFEAFINENMKNIREENIIDNFIDKIIEENNYLIENKNEATPFYIIIDNINTEEYFKVLKKLFDNDENNNIYYYGIISIDTPFGKTKFLELYNKKCFERGKLGYYVHYLYSNKTNLTNKNADNINNFFKEIGGSINILKDFIQLINFKEYIDECPNENNDFLMKYIKYIKLIITSDNYNCLHIEDIEFKNEEIKNKFISNYKNLLLSYLNRDNDETISKLFSDVNGIFFEKQIILDLLLDKIKTDKDRNFKELNVHTIYCMKFDLNKIDVSQYKNKDIIIIQDSKTGEIYDFGLITDNSIKLYQVSIKKSIQDLLKLNKKLIEVDCNYMLNNCLNNIGNYQNFNFGIITSVSAFNEYAELIREKSKNEKEGNLNNLEKIKNKITKTSYYLMKEHCQKNNYELLVYDLNKKKVYVENDLNELIEYNLYKFQNEKKLNIPKLKSIIKFNPTKISIKQFKKDKFIDKLNETKLFSGLEKKENQNSLTILGKFDFKNEFLKIEEIEEDNLFLYISGKKKNEDKSLEILKYKNETIVNEIKGEKRIVPKNNDLNITKKNSEIILFNIGDKITFLGNKRKRNSEK